MVSAATISSNPKGASAHTEQKVDIGMGSVADFVAKVAMQEKGVHLWVQG